MCRPRRGKRREATGTKIYDVCGNPNAFGLPIHNGCSHSPASNDFAFTQLPIVDIISSEDRLTVRISISFAFLSDGQLLRQNGAELSLTDRHGRAGLEGMPETFFLAAKVVLRNFLAVTIESPCGPCIAQSKGVDLLRFVRR